MPTDLLPFEPAYLLPSIQARLREASMLVCIRPSKIWGPTSLQQGAKSLQSRSSGRRTMYEDTSINRRAQALRLRQAMGKAILISMREQLPKKLLVEGDSRDS